jgi:hypothetical protein
MLLLSVVAGASASRVAAQERHEVTGTRVAVYNLAGQITLGPGGGSAVIVEVTRGGADGARLKVEQGPIGGRETLRVIYPSTDIDYPAIGWHGSTEVRVREDGTFGDHQRGESWRDGARVRISNRGDFEGYADLKVSVPEGQRLDVYLAVGKLTATNVKGDLRLDASDADVTTSHTVGPLVIDVGSGGVSVSDAQGDVSLDTGSGDVDATNVRGDALNVDTGSGTATVSQSTTRLLDLDTGSGDIEVTAAAAQQVRLDTGSGSIRCELTSRPADLDIDTGSGGITLTLPSDYGATLDVETGSGGIDVDFPVEARRFGSDHLTGKIGDGQGTLRVDTGSGSVRILRRAS